MKVAFTSVHFETNPERAGEWTRMGPPSILRDAVQAARPQDSGHQQEGQSLPDPWSVVEGFADELTRDKHENHARALQTWRGLLACLALASDFAPAIKVSHIKLPGRDRFTQVVSVLQPSLAILASNYDPARATAISELGALHLAAGLPPVALLVPTTFVAPAQSLPEGVLSPAAQIPWIVSDVVYDPTNREGGGAWVGPVKAKHYRLLAVYLDGLLETIPTFQDLGPDASHHVRALVESANRRASRLATLLRDFRAAAVSAEASARVSGESFSLTPSSIRVPAFADLLYRRLLYFQHASMEGGSSDLQIKVRRSAADLFDDVILADPAADFDSDPGRILVINDTSVADLRGDAGLSERLQVRAAAKNRLVLRPQDLFSPELIHLPRGSAEGHKGSNTEQPGWLGLEKFVLPLTPLALLLFDNLVGGASPRLTLVQLGAGRVSATLTVDRITARGTEPLRLVREYHSEADGRGAAGRLLRRAPSSVLTMWPNLSSEDWHLFQVFVQSGGSATIGDTEKASRIMPLWPVSGTRLGQMVAALPKPRVAAALALLKSWSAIKQADEASWTVTEVELSPVKRLVETKIRPEAFIVSDGDTQFDRQCNGLVMFAAEPAAQRRIGGQVVIGLDFGSSNTTAIYRRARGIEGPPTPFTFTGGLVIDALREFDNTGQLGAVSDVEFYTRADRAVPIPTILGDRLLAHENRDNRMAGAAFYVAVLHDIQDSIAAACGLDEGRPLRFNIKWEPRRAWLSRSFLRQFCLMVLAECAAFGIDVRNREAVTWRVSYPSAFTGTQADEFCDSFPNIFEDIGLGRILPAIYTESDCAAHYFRSKGAGAQVGTTIVMDIGGGTTDVAFWQDEQQKKPLSWQGSVKFAGQQLILLPLRSELSMLRDGDLDGEVRSQTFLMMVSARPGEAKSDFEVALGDIVHGPVLADDVELNALSMLINGKHFGRSSDAVLSTIGQDHPARRIVDTMELGLAGLLWFMGRQTKQLLEEAANGSAHADPSLMHNIAICIGGRPSLIIRQLVLRRRGRSGRPRDAGGIFKRVFLEAAGLSPEHEGQPRNVWFSFSEPQDAKLEVAYGLLTNNRDGAAEPEARGVILGEVGKQGKKTLPAMSRIGLDDIDPNRPVYPHPDAPEMTRFFDCLAELGQERGFEGFLKDWRPSKAEITMAVTEAEFRLAREFEALHPELNEPSAEPRPAPSRGRPTMEVQPPFLALLSALMQEKLRVA